MATDGLTIRFRTPDWTVQCGLMVFQPNRDYCLAAYDTDQALRAAGLLRCFGCEILQAPIPYGHRS